MVARVTNASSYFAYIVRCCDGTFYTGWTTDVAARVLQHNAKKGAKYTRSRLPVVLIYSLRCSSKKAALQQERKIKKLSRSQKINLIVEQAESI